ncbi:MAG: outer membrane beta-barrel protein [Ferruginibacter sp.]
MRKLLVIFLVLTAALPAFSQTPSDKKKIDLVNRAGDHFMVQLASNTLTSLPDSINSHVKGLNRSANIYLMLNKPFKGDPRFSVAFGIGVSTSNIYFKNMIVDIGSVNKVLPFTAVDSVNHFKKYKLSTAYLEVPVEFRFTANPNTPGKTLKGALGVKVGTMLNAHTKGKTLQNGTGNTINDISEKIGSKKFFNTTRLSATARIGYGNFSVFGAYSLTSVFKDGVAPPSKLLQVGLTISGL